MKLELGLFVGGRGLRMGGAAKGLLALPDGETVLARLLRVGAQAAPEATPVLVGDAAAYATFALPAISDAPRGVGPLGGLRALLADAAKKGLDGVLALACDLPYVAPALIARLTRERPDALALASRDGELWQPLAARYATGALPVLDETLAAGERSFQRFFARLGERAAELALDASERATLRDWDRPEDMR